MGKDIKYKICGQQVLLAIADLYWLWETAKNLSFANNSWLALIALTVSKSTSRQRKTQPRYQWAWISGNLLQIKYNMQKSWYTFKGN